MRGALQQSLTVGRVKKAGRTAGCRGASSAGSCNLHAMPQIQIDRRMQQRPADSEPRHTARAERAANAQKRRSIAIQTHFKALSSQTSGLAKFPGAASQSESKGRKKCAFSGHFRAYSHSLHVCARPKRVDLQLLTHGHAMCVNGRQSRNRRLPRARLMSVAIPAWNISPF